MKVMRKGVIFLVLSFLMINACTPLPPGRKEFNEGSAFYKQKKFDEALASYQKALEKNENYEKAAYNIGAIYFEKKDYENAEKYLQKTLEINDNNNNANYLISSIYLGRSDYQNAYDHIIKTRGKDEANFFRSLVKILIKKRYSFDGKIAVSPEYHLEQLPETEFNWTEWQEGRINYKIYVKNSGERGAFQFTSKNGADKFSDYIGKILKSIKYERVALNNSSDFTFRVSGEIYIDPVGTEITQNQSTFEEIMDSNLLSIANPGTQMCWYGAMVSDFTVEGEIRTELTIKSDGSVINSRIIDRYRAPESVAKCILDELKEVKFNEFPDKKERKLIVISNF